jgi:serine/threonine-protein kinase
MAEIYVCRLQGIGGFDKEVVVKRIIPERAGDPHFVRMFLDEARMVANLSHPNIVQVFEIGEQDGVPFMAMEYVKGVTLGMIIRETQKQRKIHLGHCVSLIAGIADALDYAHNAPGPDGQPLGLVHRDVSPGNIVISREGIPKLLDFGVALARGRLSQTEAGTVKGKFRYMAPEQVSQSPLDQRADVFSLGICLFELTAGAHPFGPPGGSDVAVLRNIVHGVYPNPSDLVPNYPKDLEQVVLSAIEQDVNKRCPSARELRERLESFLTATRYASSRRDLVPWMRDLFPDFSNLTKTGGLTAFSVGTPSGGMPITPVTPTHATASLGPIPTQMAGQSWSYPEEGWKAPGLGPSDTTKLNSGGPVLAGPASRARWKWPAVGGAAVLAVVGLLAVLRVGPFARSRPTVATTPAPGLPAAASADEAAIAYLDAAEKQALEKHFEPALDLLAKAGELRGLRPELNIRLARLRHTVATNSLLHKARASADESDWRAALTAARGVLDRDPENHEARQLVASARAALDLRAPAPVGRAPARDGAVTITTRPPAMVYLDDQPMGRSPITRRPVAAGPHVVRISASGYRSTETDIKVTPRQTLALVLPLTAEGGESAPRAAARESNVPASPASAEVKTAVPPSAEAAPRLDPRPEPAVVRAAPAADPPAPAPSPPAVASAKAVSTPPATKTAPAPAPGGLVRSSFSQNSIPKPTLPHSFVAQSAEQVGRACQLVEGALVKDAGLEPAYARGITGVFRQALPNNASVYPVAMYYFLVREAALRHDNRTAAANLANAQAGGTLVKFRDLPAFDRPL